jgi:hypothetical protein
VLNLTDPALSRAARDVLRDTATYHSNYFSPGPSPVPESFEERNVRVGRDGVFVGSRKVADLRQVVEHIARTDVFEIQKWRAGAMSKTRKGAFIGAAAGLALGMGVALGICGDMTCGVAFVGGYSGLGAGIGAGTGAIMAASHRTDLVYGDAAAAGERRQPRAEPCPRRGVREAQEALRREGLSGDGS